MRAVVTYSAFGKDVPSARGQAEKEGKRSESLKSGNDGMLAMRLGLSLCVRGIRYE